jgi:hypothetical protein
MPGKADSLKPVVTERNKGGRPSKLKPDEKTLRDVRGLAQIQASHGEAAAFFRVSVPTFERFIRKKIVRDTWNEGLGEGKIGLRRTQFALAKRSAAMAIFLGKQYLGHVDKQEFTGKDGLPLEVAGAGTVIIIHDNGRDPPAD